MSNAAICYSVRVLDAQAHLFAITLTIAQPAAVQGVSLPVWIPGSYLVREFAKNLQRLQAHQSNQTIELTQIDKCNWQATCRTDRPLVLHYEVYALDHSCLLYTSPS